ncbi:MAG: nucleotide exchange factor GrpE [Rickettsiales bacterium]|nr:nucleotide exchange factor GrpE [Rickettsiales bacterium]
MSIERKMPSIGDKSMEKQEQVQHGATGEKVAGENELKNAGINEEEIDMETADEVQEDGNGNNKDEKLEAANTQIAELQQQKSELERKLMYMVAEYDNAKKRFERELDDANKFAVSKFAKDAVKIYDVLFTAIEHANPEGDKVLYDGVKMTIGEFDTMFERIGMVQIAPQVGERFDHNKHEAISRVPSELEIGAIVQVIRPGYELNGRLLRAAMVVVSSGQ